MLQQYAGSQGTPVKVTIVYLYITTATQHIIVLSYTCTGATAYVGSHFGKPNMTIQASNFTCEGHEEVLSECNHASFPLEMGKTLIRQVEVAGVSCQCPLGGDSCATVSVTPIETSSVAAGQTFVGTPLYILIGVVCITISVTIIIL